MPPDEKETPPGEGGAPNIANEDIGTRNDTPPVHPAASPLDEATRLVIDHFPGTIDVTFSMRRETWSPIPWNATPLPGSARSPFDRRGFRREAGR